MSSEPYASARTVLDHRKRQLTRQQGIDRAGRGRSRNLRLIYLPIHASWLNRWRSTSRPPREALTSNDFEDLDALAARITTFEDHYHQIARPFDWTVTRNIRERVLNKITKYNPTLHTRRLTISTCGHIY
jgi:hypothetical protein